MSRKWIITALLAACIPSMALAQNTETTTERIGTSEQNIERDNFAYVSSDVGVPKTLHLRTNLLYDAALLPSIGIEYSFARHWSFLAEGTCMWLGSNSTHRYWRGSTAGLEIRYWPVRSLAATLHRGHHIGLYTAAFRYDFEFGDRGQMADINYGGGISYGYSTPIGRQLSLDFGIVLGYIGGKYLEYVPVDSHYVWQGTWNRNYFGPIKAEITLVWHIELKKKGGEQW